MGFMRRALMLAVIRLVPMPSMLSTTELLAPWPMETSTTMATTPITTPRMVRNERILLPAMALTAILNDW